MPFQRSCLYHADLPYKILEEDQEEEYNKLVASKEWFTSLPLAIMYKKEKEHGQIRQNARKRKGHSKLETSEIGS